MSHNISIGNKSFNYTYNVSAMFYDCYKDNGIREHYGMNGNDALPVLTALLLHLEANEERLRKLEPSNGWGSYGGALLFVKDMIKASSNHPDDIWSGD